MNEPTNLSAQQEQMSKAMERDIDERTTAIWSWVRENRHSLCSERGCRMMREAIDAATESLQYQLAPLIGEIELLKLQIAVAKDKAKRDCAERDKTISALQKEAKATRTKYEKAMRELDELREKPVEAAEGMPVEDEPLAI